MDTLQVFDSNLIGNDAYFNPSQSMFIEASAGTGKTYTIQQIVARLICDGTKLSQILLVTYTEKAAGELKDRIRKKIQEVLETKHLVKDVGEELRDDKLVLFETALRELDGAQIFTIHSFCQKTLKTYAYDAGRPFDMQLVDDALVKNIIQRKIRDEWPNNPKFKSLFIHTDDESIDGTSDIENTDAENNENTSSDQTSDLKDTLEKIEDILVHAIPKYYLDNHGNENETIVKLNTPIEPTKPVKPDFYDEYNNITDFQSLFLISNFSRIYDILLKHKDYKTNKGSKGYKLINDLCDELKIWQGGKLYNKGDYPPSKRTWTNELIEALNALEEISKKLEKIKSFKNGIYEYQKSIKAYHLSTFLYHVLPDLYKEWRQEKLNHKNESYQDMITAVHQAVVLDEDSRLRDELRKAYTYAIIDEFQDTNRLQWDIFRTLFFEDANHSRVPNHSLFVVGDPKQSIYAFQGADLTVYQEAIRTIGNGKRLNTNYRSTTDVIEACNHLFDTADGSQFFNDNNLVFSASESPNNKAPTHFDGEPTSPVWLSTEDISESDFAKLAAQTIVECCKMDENNQHTRLQIFNKDNKDNPNALRNVSFKDFAILARTRSEFPFIETELQNLGIPFVRYKDDNLFNSRECMQWIALFKAIDADDFTAYNRRILNEALLTDFFIPEQISQRIECGKQNNLASTVCHKLHTVNLNKYDDPFCPERKQLAKYHALARKFKWAEMLECIYHESKIETQTANNLSKLQALAKFQQIGNYSIEYLYAHRCTLQELVKHLDNLQKKADETSDNDGNLVARGTDFDAVQLMTIHASKGLEFPIVIGVAGFKGYNNKINGPFTYHEGEGETLRKKLGFDKSAKQKQKEEDIKEWKRLFYVAYTRASALLILPRYNKICDIFLKLSINAFATRKENTAYIRTLTLNNTSLDVLKNDVACVLNATTNQLPSADDSNTQKDAIQDLQKSLGRKSLIQHSYSTLANKVQLKEVETHPDTPDCNHHCTESIQDDESLVIDEPEIRDANGKSTNFATDGEEEDDKPQYILVPNVDKNPNPIAHDADYDENYPPISDTNYPRGKQLGNAIHEVFEKIDFNKAQATLDDFQNDSEVTALIEQTYAKYGLSISKHHEWHTITSEFVWRTLNAKLPVIAGARDTQDTFALKDLPENDHRAEVEFFLEGDLIHENHTPSSGEYFSKGFIDLLFVHEINGIKRYCILDWKSDRMESEQYASPSALKDKVNREYAVQRVLYSYCLIQWLQQFYPGLSEDKIFEQHFGGIYYAFVRGTAAGTANGIYAQTWASFQILKKSYEKIHRLMFTSAPQENEDND